MKAKLLRTVLRGALAASAPRPRLDRQHCSLSAREHRAHAVAYGRDARIDVHRVGARGDHEELVARVAHDAITRPETLLQRLGKTAQAGIAGSTRIGKNVTLAGQVGVVNHIEIGEGAVIGPQSGVPQSVPAGAVLSGGVAAAPHHEWLKVMTLLPQLPKLWSSVRRLEKQLAHLLRTGEKEP